MPGRRSSIRLSDLSQDVRDALKESGIEVTESVNKFNVVPKAERTFQGQLFDSRIEMEVYRELVKFFPKRRIQLQPAFQLQPPFADSAGKQRQAIDYVADFLLGPPRKSSVGVLKAEQHVIDVKGMFTPEFMLKEKLFAFQYNRLIVTVRTIKELYLKLLQLKLITSCQVPSKLQRSLRAQSPKESLSPSKDTDQILEKLLITSSASSDAQVT